MEDVSNIETIISNAADVVLPAISVSVFVSIAKGIVVVVADVVIIDGPLLLVLVAADAVVVVIVVVVVVVE